MIFRNLYNKIHLNKRVNMFSELKKSFADIFKPFENSSNPLFTDEELAALLNIKRHCEHPECHRSIVLDPDGYTCRNCKDYYLNLTCLDHAKTELHRFRNKHDVSEFIRESCNSPKCFSASEKDINAFICIVCADIRDNKFAEMKQRLEQIEDTATRRILAGSIKNMLRRTVSLQPCLCEPHPHTNEAKCDCGKFTPEYAKARQKYVRKRDASMEAAKVLAFIQSSCDQPLCKIASKGRITRFVEPHSLPAPACARCERLYGKGNPNDSHYIGSKQRWESEVFQYDKVVKYMKGTCQTKKCFFSVKNIDVVDATNAEYCVVCYDALHYDIDHKKQEIKDAEELQETSFRSEPGSETTIGLSIVVEESQSQDSVGVKAVSGPRETSFRRPDLERIAEESGDEDIESMREGDITPSPAY